MGKRCQWGLCKSDSRYRDRLPPGLVFIPFARPWVDMEKCLRWIKACGRPHHQLNVDKINKHRYICSKHFVEIINGRPSPDFPDPLSAISYSGSEKPSRRKTQTNRNGPLATSYSKRLLDSELVLSAVDEGPPQIAKSDVPVTASDVCPNCHQPYGSGKKRRLIDTCGHGRCCQCMFETDICPICVANAKEQFNINSESESVSTKTASELDEEEENPIPVRMFANQDIGHSHDLSSSSAGKCRQKKRKSNNVNNQAIGHSHDLSSSSAGKYRQKKRKSNNVNNQSKRCKTVEHENGNNGSKTCKTVEHEENGNIWINDAEQKKHGSKKRKDTGSFVCHDAVNIERNKESEKEKTLLARADQSDQDQYLVESGQCDENYPRPLCFIESEQNENQAEKNENQASSLDCHCYEVMEESDEETDISINTNGHTLNTNATEKTCQEKSTEVSSDKQKSVKKLRGVQTTRTSSIGNLSESNKGILSSSTINHNKRIDIKPKGTQSNNIVTLPMVTAVNENVTNRIPVILNPLFIVDNICYCVMSGHPSSAPIESNDKNGQADTTISEQEANTEQDTTKSDCKESNPFLCAICDQAFTSCRNLRRHAKCHPCKKSEPYKCGLCGKLFSGPGWLPKHVRSHYQELEKLYKCTVCDKAFIWSSKLKCHMRRHTGEKPYQCSICSKAFSDYTNLRRHKKRHNGVRPYLCAVCGMSFGYQNVLTSHMRLHTGERPFKCTVCGKTFTQLSTCNKHKCCKGEKQTIKVS